MSLARLPPKKLLQPLIFTPERKKLLDGSDNSNTPWGETDRHMPSVAIPMHAYFHATKASFPHIQVPVFLVITSGRHPKSRQKPRSSVLVTVTTVTTAGGCGWLWHGSPMMGVSGCGLPWPVLLVAESPPPSPPSRPPQPQPHGQGGRWGCAGWLRGKIGCAKGARLWCATKTGCARGARGARGARRMR